jgi:hypothetical protein
MSNRRTHQFVLLLNDFERDALDRVVETQGFRDASEALRYLIRKAADPEGAYLPCPSCGGRTAICSPGCPEVERRKAEAAS